MNAEHAPADRSGEIRAVVISLVLTTLLGCSYIFWRWAMKDAHIDGVLRCITFVCAMVALHVWGYQAYRRQWQGKTSAVGQPVSDDVQPDGMGAGVLLYEAKTGKKVNIAFVLLQQALALLFTSILLDGGVLFRFCLISVLVFWLSVLIIALARRRPMTAVDAALFSVGFWPLMGVVILAGRIVWWLKWVM